MKISSNGHYLVDAHQQPFFYLADTAWGLFYYLTREEVADYLRNRRDKGFTVVMACIVWDQGLRFGTTSRRARTRYGHEPFVDSEASRPNEAFFEHVDAVLESARAMDLWVSLLPTWGQYLMPRASTPGDVAFDLASAREFGRFLGCRYRESDVFWVVGADRSPAAPDDAYAGGIRALAEGIRAGDDGRHLMTSHPAAIHSSSEWFHDESWLDFNMLQTSTAWDLNNYRLILRDYERTPAKPTVDGETRYENSHEVFTGVPHGRKVTAHQVRKAAYNAVLSGAMGHTYGCRDVWSFHVPSSEPPVWDIGTHWKVAIDFPGAFQMGLMRKLMCDHAWFNLVPDLRRQIVLTGCGEGGTYTPAAISRDREVALVYVPEGQDIVVNTAAIAGTTTELTWFDPRTGRATLVGVYPAGELVPLKVPRSEGDPDFVLIMKKGTRSRNDRS